MPGPRTPTRRDAVRNRAALTAAAAAVFRAEGLDVPVDEIARRAGVGVATLYRHFPAKTDLIVAITAAVVEQLADAVGEVLERDDARDVLAEVLAAAARHQEQNRWFIQAISENPLPDDARATLLDRVVALLDPVVEVAHAAGTLDQRYDATDLLTVVRMLGSAGIGPAGRPPSRYVDAIATGLAPARR